VGPAAGTRSGEAKVTFASPQAFAPMPTRRDAIFRRSLAVADLAAACGGLAMAALVRAQRFGVVSVATVPLIVLIIKLCGRYDRDEVVLRKSTLDEAPALAALAAAYALAWSLVTLMFNVHSSRGALLVLWATTTALLIAFRALARRFGRRWAPPERVLIMGGAGAGSSVAEQLEADFSARVEVVGCLPLEFESPRPDSWTDHRQESDKPAIEDLSAAIAQLGAQRVIVIPAGSDPDPMFNAVTAANRLGVKVSIVPNVFEVIGSSVEFDEVGGMTLLSVKRPGLGRSSALVKRGMDIVGSILGLIILSPMGAIVAIAIKLDSPGPVFFRQPRVGRNGRPFQMIKFRSMIDQAEARRNELDPLNESDGIFKMKRDPRVTRIGRFLRRTSLDEMPQLINVLRGEMSLVGPRPLIPEEDRRVEGHHRRRLQLAPGMTGPWQVLGPERPPLGEMVKLDYLYTANWSLWSDIKYLLRTAGHVVGRRGV
jgi:exopolysaccharide biosynthesis polyprenyl glycosylphosphotransferase